MNITILEGEKEKRKKAWAKAISNFYLSGVHPTPAMNLIANRFINIEIDLQESVMLMIKTLREENS